MLPAMPPTVLPASSLQMEVVPAKLRERYESIISRTDAVCLAHLTAEYAALCRKMAAALCRKRPSPVTNGQPASWACGITYALGSVNFLFDKTQTPHLSARALREYFGVSESNTAAKASLLRRIFALSPFSAEWCLPSQMANNPLLWMVSVSGVLIDIRTAPRELQELALAKGLIPYLPETARSIIE